MRFRVYLASLNRWYKFRKYIEVYDTDYSNISELFRDMDHYSVTNFGGILVSHSDIIRIEVVAYDEYDESIV